jgi:hypothetical protein
MREFFLVAAAAAGVFIAPHTASASEFSGSGGYHGGFDIGPLGQCFNPRGCAHKDIYGYYGRGSYVQGCPVARERILTSSGHVIYRRHRACY